MNTTTPTKTCSSLNCNTIDAELFHAYSALSFPFEPWIACHRLICEHMNGEWRERKVGSKPVVETDSDGKLYFRMDYAFSHARQRSSFTSSILTISIAENHGAGQIIGCNSVDADLKRYMGLSYFDISSDARLLHEYLGIENDFQPWIEGQISKFRIRRGIDYVEFKAKGTCHDSNISIAPSCAFEIAKDQNTRRAEQIRICTDISVKYGRGLKFGLDEQGDGFEKLSKLLLTAEARPSRSSRKRNSATKSSLI